MARQTSDRRVTCLRDISLTIIRRVMTTHSTISGKGKELRPVPFLLLVVALPHLGGCGTPDTLPGNRHFGSILNNDASNIMYAGSGEDMTPEEYRKGVGHLLDAKPGLLAQSIGQPDPVFYQSEVATPYNKYGPETNRMVPSMRVLAAKGTDPLALTAEVCRQRGVPIVASYRMNAEDMGPGGLEVFDFARDNPQFRLGDRGCLDPAHPEVFEHRMQIFTEVVENYDIDGLEFDFKRWIFMVSNPSENHTVLTRMVRETRQMLDEVARKKGRKRLLLGVRVEPIVSGKLDKADFPGAQNPPWNRSCEASGLDIRTWIEEGLVDYVCPSHFWPKWPGLPRTSEFVELAKGKDIGIYPTVFPHPAWVRRQGSSHRARRYGAHAALQERPLRSGTELLPRWRGRNQHVQLAPPPPEGHAPRSDAALLGRR